MWQMEEGIGPSEEMTRIEWSENQILSPGCPFCYPSHLFYPLPRPCRRSCYRLQLGRFLKSPHKVRHMIYELIVGFDQQVHIKSDLKSNGISMTLSKGRRKDRHAETSRIGFTAEYRAPG